MSNKKKSGTRIGSTGGTGGGIRALGAALLGIVALHESHAADRPQDEKPDETAREETVTDEAVADSTSTEEGQTAESADASVASDQDEETLAESDLPGEEVVADSPVALETLEEQVPAAQDVLSMHETTLDGLTLASAGDGVTGEGAAASRSEDAESSGASTAAAGAGMAGAAASAAPSPVWAGLGLLGATSVGAAGGGGGGGGGGRPAVHSPPPAGDPPAAEPPAPKPTAPEPPAAAPSLQGRVVDGNVSGAVVFYDTNGNWVRDPGELFTVTALDGSYKLTGHDLGKSGNVVAESGGTDTLTGQKVGLMAAAGGYAAVNPMTMLLAVSPNLRESDLLSRLDLDGLDLRNFDPVGMMRDGSDGAQTALALKSFVVAQQVFTIVQAAAELKAAADGEDGNTQVGKSDITVVARALADSIMTGTGSPQQILLAGAHAALQAASGDSPSAELSSLVHRIGDALETMLPALETAAAGLADALQTHNEGMQANAVAIAAIAQSALLHAVRDGDLTLLASLSEPDALQRLADAYAEAIGYGNPADGVAAPIPHILTVQQALVAPPGTVFVIADSAANLHAKLLAGPHGPALLDMAVSVAVLDAPTVAEAALISKIPAAKFLVSRVAGEGHVSFDYADLHDLQSAGLYFDPDDSVTVVLQNEELPLLADSAVDLGGMAVDTIDAAGDWVQISEATAIALTENGLAFAHGDTVTMQAAGTQLQTTLEDLQDLGVDVVTNAHGPSLVLSLGEPAALGAGSMPRFDPALQVDLRADAAQFDALLDRAAELASSGIDRIVIEGSADLSGRDGESLAAALQQAGISAIHLSDDATLSIGDLQLRALLDADAVSADDLADISLHDATATPGNDGQLDVSLAELIDIGVDRVDAAGELLVEVGIALSSENVNSELQALLSKLPDDAPLFAADDHVTLSIGQVQTDAVDDDVLVELKLIGVDDIEGIDSAGNAAIRHLT